MPGREISETLDDVVELIYVRVTREKRLASKHLSDQTPDGPNVHRPAISQYKWKMLRERSCYCITTVAAALPHKNRNCVLWLFYDNFTGL